MTKKAETKNGAGGKQADESRLPEVEQDTEFKVTDRRHWTHPDDEGDGEDEVAVEPAKPTIIDEYRMRAEAAEQKLQEYIEAFKQFRAEQDGFRKRMSRDVDRRVELKFAEVVGELLETVDNLELAMGHARDVPGAASLVEGITLARDRFLATLERAGVEKIVPDGQAFDPNEAEAMRLDPVDDAERDGTITETLLPGYRVGDSLIRPARVAVGRLQP